MFKNFHKNKYNSGVTLIELLVVIAILAIMSATTLVSYSKFKSTMSIQNLADDIALSVRKAQGYAIGVSRNKNSDIYGVHFSTSTTNPSYKGSKKSFVIFADKNNDKKYTPTPDCGIDFSDAECLEILNITSTDEIAGINYYTGSQILLRKPVVGDNNGFDLIFKRPNPEPSFCYRAVESSNKGCNDSLNIVKVEIKVQNTKNPGFYKTVTIWNNGQISVY